MFTAAFAGCGKQSPQKNFVAKVNDNFLTEEQLDSMIKSKSTSKLYRSEVIRNWINRELLYNEAQKEGILKDEKFKKLMKESEKELAASLLTQKYYDEEKSNYETGDIESYYNRHRDEFKRFYDSYLINIIEFKSEDKAIQFRTTVLESDWEKAVTLFKGDSSFISAKNGVILYAYEIHPVSLSRIVTTLYPGEVSIVIPAEPGHFFVAQDILNYKKDSIPPFNTIKSQVEKRFLADRKNVLIQNYIKELYSNNDIEVRD